MKKLILTATCILLICSVHAQTEKEVTKMNENFTLVIHGGAGTILKKNMSSEKEREYKKKLQEALKAGFLVLNVGGKSIDAVAAVIIVLEDSPLFNAGKGAVLTNNGTVEMDASIMDGSNNLAGAVGSVKTIKNPINAAKLVMDESKHVMLNGDGADEFAKSKGLPTEEASYFITELRQQQLKKVLESEKIKLDHDVKTDEKDSGSGSIIEFDPRTDGKYGTVGAVALDKFGNLAAGTSTGGMTNKRFGRVGDSPIIGAGTYADNNTCAVSCTGHGEFFIRSVVAYDVAAKMKYKSVSVEEAANEIIHKELPAIGGSGGLIAVDNKGNYTMQFNTAGMYRGYVTEVGIINVEIYR